MELPVDRRKLDLPISESIPMSIPTRDLIRLRRNPFSYLYRSFPQGIRRLLQGVLCGFPTRSREAYTGLRWKRYAELEPSYSIALADNLTVFLVIMPPSALAKLSEPILPILILHPSSEECKLMKLLFKMVFSQPRYRRTVDFPTSEPQEPF